jgi:hypothetical protein
MPASVASRVAITRAPSRSAAWSTLLVAGTAIALGGALAIAVPHPHRLVDPELARLLRGMAALKGLLVLGALAALVWRFSHPLPRGLAIAYLLGLWCMAAATGFVWQLAVVPAAAIVFHGGEIALLVTAFRDRRS